MNRFNKRSLCAAPLLVLAACGGGGGDDSISGLDANATDVAVKGAAIAGHLGQNVAVDLALGGAYVAGVAVLESGGSRVYQTSCVDGTTTLMLTKTSVGQGFAVGDQVALAFNQCRLADGSVLNGAYKVVPRALLGAQAKGAVAANLRVETAGFSVTRSGATRTYDGTADLQMNVAGSNTDYSLTVPAGKALTIHPGTSNDIVFAAETSFMGSNSDAGNSRKFDGNAMVRYSGGVDTLRITTPLALTGSVAGDDLTPSAGQIAVTAAARGIAAAITVSGSTVAIKADVNSDGVWDQSANVSWATATGHQ